MAVTLTTATTLIREYLDEPNPQFWSNTEITNWINEACTDIARRAETKRNKSTIAVTAGTATYTMPSDMFRAHRIEFIPTGSPNTYTVEYRGYMEMDQIWGINQQWPANYPSYYTLWSQPPSLSIILYPVPNQAGTLNVYYYQQITAVSSGTDTLDVLPGWEDLVYDYTVYRAFRKDADPRWQEYKKTYEEQLMFLMDSSRSFQDQAGTFTTGQTSLPAWLTSTEAW